MESISIRNMNLKYYAITYLMYDQECLYFVVTSSEKSAVIYFILQAKKSGIDIDFKDIVKVKAIDIINPN